MGCRDLWWPKTLQRLRCSIMPVCQEQNPSVDQGRWRQIVCIKWDGYLEARLFNGRINGILFSNNFCFLEFFGGASYFLSSVSLYYMWLHPETAAVPKFARLKEGAPKDYFSSWGAVVVSCVLVPWHCCHLEPLISECVEICIRLLCSLKLATKLRTASCIYLSSTGIAVLCLLVQCRRWSSGLCAY